MENAFINVKRVAHAEKPDGGPEWGVRFTVTMLFPK